MKSGTVAVVGRANAGKSTLINVLVGEKIAITSPKPQTTRDRILGILTRDEYQIVFEDTPGVYKARSELNNRMQKATRDAAKDVDLIMFLLDGHEGVKQEDIDLAENFSGRGIPTIVVFTKIDIMPKEKLPDEIRKLEVLKNVSDIIPISARKGKNIKELMDVILSHLPEGGYIFDQNTVSDKSEKFMIAEIMREKILLEYDKEIPHGVAVVVNKFEQRPNGIYDIDLDIVCEKDNHKAILIGKQGSALKVTNTFAREAMEKFLGNKVFLTVFVKVKEDWQDNPSLLKEYGYSKDDYE